MAKIEITEDQWREDLARVEQEALQIDQDGLTRKEIMALLGVGSRATTRFIDSQIASGRMAAGRRPIINAAGNPWRTVVYCPKGD